MRELVQLVAAATLVLAAASFVSLADAGTSFAAPLPTLAPVGPARLTLTLSARGVQVYECRVTSAAAAGAAEWAFVAPEAELFDAMGRRAGSHGAGPFWHAGDGSRIVGSVTALHDAPVAGAIPWLLLQARPTGADGAGRTFGRVSHVQRINTQGGVAPAAGCQRETLGHTVRVPYSADYLFFTTT